MTRDELEELGLYDPSAPDAAERLELLELALQYGATTEEMQQAIAERSLHAVAVMNVIVGGAERLTFEDVVARAGTDPDVARRLWRALGLPDPAPGSASWTERDITVMVSLDFLWQTIGEDAALQIARATGSAMARLADTEVAMIRSLAEAPLRTAGGSNVDVAHELLRASRDLLPGMLPMIDAVHRHHLAASGRRYSLWGVRPTEHSTTDAVIGFVDLVGFTTLSQQLDPTELDAILRRFEERALDATRRPLDRLVKLIGDEAMFVSGSASDAVEIVRSLAHPALPPMRAGLAAGTFTVREGDVFGPVVNLAARLVARAEPGQILLDRAAAQRLGLDAVDALGSQTIAGFEEPVEVFTPRTSAPLGD
jgi:class 3 adenylate cyclase